MPPAHPSNDAEAEAQGALSRWEKAGARVERLSGGLINATYAVEHSADQFILQRVNPIFSELIHTNIHAVTEHLANKGLTTPKLVPNSEGEWFSRVEGHVWRLMTRVSGVSLERPSTATVAEAGRMLGVFHQALRDLTHDFTGMRSGVHDTELHLKRLLAALQCFPSHRLLGKVEPLAESIFRSAAELPELEAGGVRVVHGDPKFNNLLFEPGPTPRALCWVDLDTVGPASLATELGDAWRSWCNVRGEDEAMAAFDLTLFEASAKAYGTVMADLDPPEREGLLYGVEWITLELCARFLTDSLEERYFGWDAARFPAAGEHQLLRAEGQWSLHQQVLATREARAQILDRALTRPGADKPE